MALDLAEEMLRLARRKECPGEIDHVQADVLSLPFCPGVFDAVVCYSSFPHFQDKVQALREVRRVLRAGGRLFICHTSCKDTINHIHRSIQVVSHDLVPDAPEMESMLLDAGFADVVVQDQPDSYLASARKAS